MIINFNNIIIMNYWLFSDTLVSIMYSTSLVSGPAVGVKDVMESMSEFRDLNLNKNGTIFIWEKTDADKLQPVYPKSTYDRIQNKVLRVLIPFFVEIAKLPNCEFIRSRHFRFFENYFDDILNLTGQKILELVTSNENVFIMQQNVIKKIEKHNKGVQDLVEARRYFEESKNAGIVFPMIEDSSARFIYLVSQHTYMGIGQILRMLVLEEKIEVFSMNCRPFFGELVIHYFYHSMYFVQNSLIVCPLIFCLIISVYLLIGDFRYLSYSVYMLNYIVFGVRSNFTPVSVKGLFADNVIKNGILIFFFVSSIHILIPQLTHIASVSNYFFHLLFIYCNIFIFASLKSYFGKKTGYTEAVFLILSILGGSFIILYLYNFMDIYVIIEIIGFATYGLVSLVKNGQASIAVAKYYFFSIFASCFLLLSFFFFLRAFGDLMITFVSDSLFYYNYIYKNLPHYNYLSMFCDELGVVESFWSASNTVEETVLQLTNYAGNRLILDYAYLANHVKALYEALTLQHDMTARKRALSRSEFHKGFDILRVFLHFHTEVSNLDTFYKKYILQTSLDTSQLNLLKAKFVGFVSSIANYERLLFEDKVGKYELYKFYSNISKFFVIRFSVNILNYLVNHTILFPLLFAKNSILSILSKDISFTHPFGYTIGPNWEKSIYFLLHPFSSIYTFVQNFAKERALYRVYFGRDYVVTKMKATSTYMLNQWVVLYYFINFVQNLDMNLLSDFEHYYLPGKVKIKKNVFLEKVYFVLSHYLDTFTSRFGLSDEDDSDSVILGKYLGDANITDYTVLKHLPVGVKTFEVFSKEELPKLLVFGPQNSVELKDYRENEDVFDNVTSLGGDTSIIFFKSNIDKFVEKHQSYNPYLREDFEKALKKTLQSVFISSNNDHELAVLLLKIYFDYMPIGDYLPFLASIKVIDFRDLDMDREHFKQISHFYLCFRGKTFFMREEYINLMRFTVTYILPEELVDLGIFPKKCDYSNFLRNLKWRYKRELYNLTRYHSYIFRYHMYAENAQPLAVFKPYIPGIYGLSFSYNVRFFLYFFLTDPLFLLLGNGYSSEDFGCSNINILTFFLNYSIYSVINGVCKPFLYWNSVLPSSDVVKAWYSPVKLISIVTADVAMDIGSWVTDEALFTFESFLYLPDNISSLVVEHGKEYFFSFLYLPENLKSFLVQYVIEHFIAYCGHVVLNTNYDSLYFSCRDLLSDKLSCFGMTNIYNCSLELLTSFFQIKSLNFGLYNVAQDYWDLLTFKNLNSEFKFLGYNSLVYKNYSERAKLIPEFWLINFKKVYTNCETEQVCLPDVLEFVNSCTFRDFNLKTGLICSDHNIFCGCNIDRRNSSISQFFLSSFSNFFTVFKSYNNQLNFDLSNTVNENILNLSDLLLGVYSNYGAYPLVEPNASLSGGIGCIDSIVQYNLFIIGNLSHSVNRKFWGDILENNFKNYFQVLNCIPVGVSCHIFSLALDSFFYSSKIISLHNLVISYYDCMFLRYLICNNTNVFFSKSLNFFHKYRALYKSGVFCARELVNNDINDIAFVFLQKFYYIFSFKQDYLYLYNKIFDLKQKNPEAFGRFVVLVRSLELKRSGSSYNAPLLVRVVGEGSSRKFEYMTFLENLKKMFNYSYSLYGEDSLSMPYALFAYVGYVHDAYFEEYNANSKKRQRLNILDLRSFSMCCNSDVVTMKLIKNNLPYFSIESFIKWDLVGILDNVAYGDQGTSVDYLFSYFINYSRKPVSIYSSCSTLGSEDLEFFFIYLQLVKLSENSSFRCKLLLKSFIKKVVWLQTNKFKLIANFSVFACKAYNISTIQLVKAYSWYLVSTTPNLEVRYGAEQEIFEKLHVSLLAKRLLDAMTYYTRDGIKYSDRPNPFFYSFQLLQSYILVAGRSMENDRLDYYYPRRNTVKRIRRLVYARSHYKRRTIFPYDSRRDMANSIKHRYLLPQSFYFKWYFFVMSEYMPERVYKIFYKNAVLPNSNYLCKRTANTYFYNQFDWPLRLMREFRYNKQNNIPRYGKIQMLPETSRGHFFYSQFFGTVSNSSSRAFVLNNFGWLNASEFDTKKRIFGLRRSIHDENDKISHLGFAYPNDCADGEDIIRYWRMQSRNHNDVYSGLSHMLIGRAGNFKGVRENLDCGYGMNPFSSKMHQGRLFTNPFSGYFFKQYKNQLMFARANFFNGYRNTISLVEVYAKNKRDPVVENLLLTEYLKKIFKEKPMFSRFPLFAATLYEYAIRETLDCGLPSQFIADQLGNHDNFIEFRGKSTFNKKNIDGMSPRLKTFFFHDQGSVKSNDVNCWSCSMFAESYLFLGDYLYLFDIIQLNNEMLLAKGVFRSLLDNMLVLYYTKINSTYDCAFGVLGVKHLNYWVPFSFMWSVFSDFYLFFGLLGKLVSKNLSEFIVGLVSIIGNLVICGIKLIGISIYLSFWYVFFIFLNSIISGYSSGCFDVVRFVLQANAQSTGEHSVMSQVFWTNEEVELLEFIVKVCANKEFYLQKNSLLISYAVLNRPVLRRVVMKLGFMSGSDPVNLYYLSKCKMFFFIVVQNFSDVTFFYLRYLLVYLGLLCGKQLVLDIPTFNTKDFYFCNLFATNTKPIFSEGFGSLTKVNFINHNCVLYFRLVGFNFSVFSDFTFLVKAGNFVECYVGYSGESVLCWLLRYIGYIWNGVFNYLFKYSGVRFGHVEELKFYKSLGTVFSAFLEFESNMNSLNFDFFHELWEVSKLIDKKYLEYANTECTSIVHSVIQNNLFGTSELGYSVLQCKELLGLSGSINIEQSYSIGSRFDDNGKRLMFFLQSPYTDTKVESILSNKYFFKLLCGFIVSQYLFFLQRFDYFTSLKVLFKYCSFDMNIISSEDLSVKLFFNNTAGVKCLTLSTGRRLFFSYDTSVDVNYSTAWFVAAGFSDVEIMEIKECLNYDEAWFFKLFETYIKDIPRVLKLNKYIFVYGFIYQLDSFFNYIDDLRPIYNFIEFFSNLSKFFVLLMIKYYFYFIDQDILKKYCGELKYFYDLLIFNTGTIWVQFGDSNYFRVSNLSLLLIVVDWFEIKCTTSGNNFDFLHFWNGFIINYPISINCFYIFEWCVNSVKEFQMVRFYMVDEISNTLSNYLFGASFKFIQGALGGWFFLSQYLVSMPSFVQRWFLGVRFLHSLVLESRECIVFFDKVLQFFGFKDNLTEEEIQRKKILSNYAFENSLCHDLVLKCLYNGEYLSFSGENIFFYPTLGISQLHPFDSYFKNVGTNGINHMLYLATFTNVKYSYFFMNSYIKLDIFGYVYYKIPTYMEGKLKQFVIDFYLHMITEDSLYPILHQKYGCFRTDLKPFYYPGYFCYFLYRFLEYTDPNYPEMDTLIKLSNKYLILVLGDPLVDFGSDILYETIMKDFEIDFNAYSSFKSGFGSSILADYYPNTHKECTSTHRIDLARHSYEFTEPSIRDSEDELQYTSIFNKARYLPDELACLDLHAKGLRFLFYRFFDVYYKKTYFAPCLETNYFELQWELAKSGYKNIFALYTKAINDYETNYHKVDVIALKQDFPKMDDETFLTYFKTAHAYRFRQCPLLPFIQSSIFSLNYLYFNWGLDVGCCEGFYYLSKYIKLKDLYPSGLKYMNQDYHVDSLGITTYTEFSIYYVFLLCYCIKPFTVYEKLVSVRIFSSLFFNFSKNFSIDYKSYNIEIGDKEKLENVRLSYMYLREQAFQYFIYKLKARIIVSHGSDPKTKIPSISEFLNEQRSLPEGYPDYFTIFDKTFCSQNDAFEKLGMQYFFENVPIDKLTKDVYKLQTLDKIFGKIFFKKATKVMLYNPDMPAITMDFYKFHTGLRQEFPIGPFEIEQWLKGKIPRIIEKKKKHPFFKKKHIRGQGIATLYETERFIAEGRQRMAKKSIDITPTYYVLLKEWLAYFNCVQETRLYFFGPGKPYHHSHFLNYYDTFHDLPSITVSDRGCPFRLYCWAILAAEDLINDELNRFHLYLSYFGDEKGYTRKRREYIESIKNLFFTPVHISLDLYSPDSCNTEYYGVLRKYCIFSAPSYNLISVDNAPGGYGFLYYSFLYLNVSILNFDMEKFECNRSCTFNDKFQIYESLHHIYVCSIYCVTSVYKQQHTLKDGYPDLFILDIDYKFMPLCYFNWRFFFPRYKYDNFAIDSKYLYFKTFLSFIELCEYYSLISIKNSFIRPNMIHEFIYRHCVCYICRVTNKESIKMGQNISESLQEYYACSLVNDLLLKYFVSKELYVTEERIGMNFYSSNLLYLLDAVLIYNCVDKTFMNLNKNICGQLVTIYDFDLLVTNNNLLYEIYLVFLFHPNFYFVQPKFFRFNNLAKFADFYLRLHSPNSVF